jgi:Fur family transcriptional regulator, ferric uptake regulator
MNTMTAKGMAEELHDQVETRLRGVDQRYTPGRRAIIDLLVNAGGPMSIGDIAELLPDLPRSSAYRHLVDLQNAGLVRRVAANDEFARFELAEDLTEHHHHLLCVACGRVIDVTPTAEFERALAQAVDQLSDAEGFSPQSHRLDVLGLCAECR